MMGVNETLKGILNEKFVVYFNVRGQHLPGATYEIHENIMIFSGIEI